MPPVSEPPRPARPAMAPRDIAPEAPRATEPAPQPAVEPATPAESGDTKPAPAKSVFDTLEEEMANLLGRTGKT